MSAESNHKQVLDQVDEELIDAAKLALNKTMALGLNYVRGDGDLTQPGARIRTSRNGVPYYYYSPALPRRQAHPTGWADVTGLTANSYGFERPTFEGGVIVGTIYNTAEHARHLEGKRRAEGGRYWVLSGLVNDAVDSEFDATETFAEEFLSLVR